MAIDKRTLSLRIVSVAAFCLIIFLAAALVTHDPNDPPAGNPRVVHNICGVIGAHVSHALMGVLGWGNYLLFALIVAIIACYVLRGSVPRAYWLTAAAVVVVLVVILSLWTFDPATSRHRGYSPEMPVRNACGLVGAEIGYYLLAYVGAGVWVMVFASLVALASVIARRPLSDRLLRIGGVLILLAFVSAGATVLHMQGVLGKDPRSVLVEGPGGILGQVVARTFVTHLGMLGAYLVLIFAGLVGLLLSTDNLIMAFPLAAWRWFCERRESHLEALKEAGNGLRGLMAAAGAKMAGVSAAEAAKAKPAPKIRTSRRSAETDDEDSETPEPKNRKAVKAEERAAKAAAKAAEAEMEEEAEEEEPEPAKPAPAKPAPAIRLAGDRKSQPAAADDTPAGKQMRLIDSSEGPGDQVPAYTFPSLDLLDPPDVFDLSAEEEHIRENAQNLEATLRQFGVDADVVGIDTGPVITQYEVSLGTGIKVGKVIGLSDDLAIGLKAPSVRIVAPLPGRGTIGIEVPNINRKVVRLRESIEDGLSLTKRHNLPLFLGKDAAGNPLVRDLTSMPHLLIGGTTGSGKSVCLNAIIMSILFTRSPRDVKFILVDPKMVEMTMFASIPHLMCPVVSDMSKVQSILEWLITKMEERYGLLAEAGVKNIVGYNALSREQIVEKFKPTSEEDEMRLTYHMPYIVLVVDELADLMMTCSKEAEAAITRLAQKSRAVGIHLILATQRPSVDVVTGLIKSNHPCRIAFQVASGVDSRTIIDGKGAEKLLGRGDMLLMQPGAAKLLRTQCTYVSEEEVNRVVDAVAKDSPREFNRELVQLRPKPPASGRGRGGASGGGGAAAATGGGGDSSDFVAQDELYLDAVRIVLQHQRGSVSLLQRKLQIGYGRASRLIDFMAEDGIVGQYSGSNAREVTMTLDEWESRRGEGVGGYDTADDEEMSTADEEMAEQT